MSCNKQPKPQWNRSIYPCRSVGWMISLGLAGWLWRLCWLCFLPRSVLARAALLHMCSFSSPGRRGSSYPGEAFLKVMADVQEGKVSLALLKALVMSHPPLLAKISHMVEPKSRGRKVHVSERWGNCQVAWQRCGYRDVWKTGANNSIQRSLHKRRRWKICCTAGELVWVAFDGAATVYTPSHPYPVSLPLS